MRPLFAHDTTVVILAFGSLFLWQAIQLVVKRRFGVGGRSSPEWTTLWIVVLLLAGFCASIAAADSRVATIDGSPWWPVIVGLTLMCLGSGFRTWAVATLGGFFKFTVTVQDDHRIVERGPYRHLRHPSYLGGIVALIGFGFMEGDWASLALMTLSVIAAMDIRLRVEERTLLGALGEPYAAYVRRTARLIPGVY